MSLNTGKDPFCSKSDQYLFDLPLSSYVLLSVHHGDRYSTRRYLHHSKFSPPKHKDAELVPKDRA